jgi:amino acid transporter
MMAQGSEAPVANLHPGLFLRKTTGLVRELGAKEALYINIAVLNPGQGFVLLLPILALYTLGDFAWPFAVGAIISVFLALTYAQLVALMPRTGGDYVFVSRVFGPIVGTMVGGTLLLMFLNFAGTNAAILGTLTFPFFVQSLGSAFNNSQLTSWSTDLAQQWPAVIVGALGILALAGVATRGLRAVSWVLLTCFVVGTIGFAVLVVLFLTHSPADFQSSFNNFAGHPDAYAQIISTSQKLGLATGATFVGSLVLIPFVAVLYGGFTWSVYPAGEIKRPMRTTLIATITALALGLVMYLVGWQALTGMTSLNFIQSASWLSANHADAYGSITSAPVLTAFYGLLVAGDPVTKVLLGVGILAWTFAIILAYLIVIPRIIFALAFDRVIPSRMADVRESSGTPINAVVAAAIGIFVFAALTILTTFISEFRNETIMLELVFTMTSLVAMLTPWLRRADYEAAPKIVRGKLFGLPPIAVIGGVSFVINAVVLVVAVVSPQISGGYDTVSILVLAVTFLWAPVAYFISKAKLRSQGIDLALAMQELPPE